MITADFLEWEQGCQLWDVQPGLEEVKLSKEQTGLIGKVFLPEVAANIQSRALILGPTQNICKLSF